MSKIIRHIKENNFAFWMSVLYVSLGGIVAGSVYPDDLLYGDWVFVGWIITFPVTIISSTYRFAAATNYYPVVIIQAFILIPTFWAFARLFPQKKR